MRRVTHCYSPFSPMHFSGEDDEQKAPITTDPDDKGGPAAGMYGEADLPIPGQSEDAVNEDHQ